MEEEDCLLVEFFTSSSSWDVHRLERILKTNCVNVNEPLLQNIESKYETDPWTNSVIFQRQPLHVAARRGDTNVVQLLLDYGAEVDIQDNLRITPLHAAAEAGHHETVELLLSRGAAVSAKDAIGNTPLHRANTHKVAEILIRNGASVRDKNDSNQSALHCVCKVSSAQRSRCLKEVVELFINHGAEVNLQDKQGSSPLHHASSSSDSGVGLMLVLIRNGAQINMQDKSGNTPLFRALPYPVKVELLLNHGAVIDVQNEWNETPMDVAVRAGLKGTLLVMLRKGVKLDVQNHLGWTALHQAALFERCEFVVQLLAYGFSVRVKTNGGQTPYELARPGSECRRLLATHIQLSNLAGLQECEDVDVDIPLSEEETEAAGKELDRIKTTNISEEVYLHGIFAMVKRPSYLLYEGVIQSIELFFQSPDFHNQFPMYGDILKATFIRSKKSRYYLTKMAVRSMMSVKRIRRCQVTPDLCWEQVVKYLEDEDLTNIILSEL